jgi:hypothetical protein
MKLGSIWRGIAKDSLHPVRTMTFAALLLLPHLALMAQMDQGLITGVVQDRSGAVIPGAQVTLTDTDTGLTLQSKAASDGEYTFPPIKIGTYKLMVSSPGFRTMTQENIRLDAQDYLRVVLVLEPGNVSQTITVSSAPALLQSQEASVGQVMSAETVNNTPLNGRNWVYIAQLATGVVPANGSRGAGKGDYNANGQRAEQNNFVLNGIDNNSYAADYMNGSSYALQPPPDALSEFKVQTANFSPEFGHSAGAVVNASIRSGTNQIHGSLWEYLRNDVLNARNFGALTIPKYRENQFGGTLGAPIIHDHLFFFGYAEANRIIFGNTLTTAVPSALMRQGNFSELLTPSLNSSGNAMTLYEPGSAGTQPLICNGAANVLCPGQIAPIAQKLLNEYPSPNTNGDKLYNNYTVNLNDADNTWQWGSRIDWNISANDQAFISYSFSNEIGYYPPPLGPVIDSGSYGTDGDNNNLTETATFSETHIFSPTLDNEFRLGYNYGKFAFLQVNSNQNTSEQWGLGGIPFNSIGLGGLPLGSVTGIAGFGPPAFSPAKKGMNVNNLLDNVAKIEGKHSLRFGYYFSDARLPFLVASYTRGSYTYNGYFTSSPGQANTGSGTADLLTDEQQSAELGSDQRFDLARLNMAGYANDDWHVTKNLTLNLGIRYDYFQPVHDIKYRMANMEITGAVTPGSSQATLLYPNSAKGQYLSPNFTNILNANNISIAYSGNGYLANPDHANFAPRIGFAYMLDPETVIRGGFGTFYGGLQNASLQQNYPFQFDSNFVNAKVCLPGNCGTDGITLSEGFSQQNNAGLINAIATPTVYSVASNARTQYSANFNLTAERSLSRNLIATVGYVGAISRHLALQYNVNAPAALTDPRLSSLSAEPFPGMGSDNYTNFAGTGSYNSLQTKVEKRYDNGLGFLAAYTWAHSLDDAPTVLGSTGDSGYRAPNLIGLANDYSNSAWDVRNRVTLNGYYQLPFGSGKHFSSQSRLVDAVTGGWSTDLQFVAQTGFPFTVSDTSAAGGLSGPNGGTPEAIVVRDPFGTGGSPDPSNSKISCAISTRTVQHWYNPCAFANPPAAFPNASTAGSAISTTKITGLAALPYLGGRRLSVPGPGYERVNMSVFKSFPTVREQSVLLRADIFNVLNTPAYAIPSVTNDGSNGGQITGTRFFQNFTPDARFFQVSVKYVF